MKRIIRQLFNIAVFIFVFFFITTIDFNYRPNQVIDVYTTNYPLKYMVEVLGDESVNVHSIYETFVPEVKVEVDEEGLEKEIITYDYQVVNSIDFELTNDMTKSILNSDLFLYSGYNFEGKFLTSMLHKEEIDFLDVRDTTLRIQKIDYNLTDVIEIQVTSIEEGVPISYVIELNDFLYEDLKVNPAVWHDPMNLLKMAIITRDVLIEKLPTKAEIIRENFDTYKGNLLRYDSRLQDVIDEGRNNLVIVDRPFLAHMQRYGLQQIAFADMYSFNRVDESDLEHIYNIMTYYEIDYVITDDIEHMSPMFRKFAETYNVDILEIHNLDILPKEDYDNGESFFTIVYEDLLTLEEALR